MKQMRRTVDIPSLIKTIPVLGVCYGAQLTAKDFGGKVEKVNKREFGSANIAVNKKMIFY